LLVRAGMTPFQALFYNFMSGQAVYLGCAIGIYLYYILLDGSAKELFISAIVIGI